MVTHVVRKPPSTTVADNDAVIALTAKISPTLSSMYRRWRDESNLEEFRVYAEEMQKLMPSGYRMFAFSQSPFGFTFSIGRPSVWQMIHDGSTTTVKRVR